MLADERAVDFEETPVARVFPVDGLEHDLMLTRPVEDDGRRFTVMRRPRQHLAGRRTRQQLPHEGFTLARLHDRTVTEDQREWCGQILEDRARELVAAAGRQHDLHTCCLRARNSSAVLVRDASVAIEQCTVDVECEKADGQWQMGEWANGQRTMQKPAASEVRAVMQLYNADSAPTSEACTTASD
jgi:hypothetical protein